MTFKRSGRLFAKSTRTREIATDFLTGIALFTLVALFAGAYEAPALPAPLAKTEALVSQTIDEMEAAGRHIPQPADVENAATSSTPRPITANVIHGSGDSPTLIVMALIFSTLSAMTFQLWRYLRRAYARPRRYRK